MMNEGLYVRCTIVPNCYRKLKRNSNRPQAASALLRLRVN